MTNLFINKLHTMKDKLPLHYLQHQVEQRISELGKSQRTSSHSDSIRLVDSRVSSVHWLDLNCNSCSSVLGSPAPSPIVSCKVRGMLKNSIQREEKNRPILSDTLKTKWFSCHLVTCYNFFFFVC